MAYFTSNVYYSDPGEPTLVICDECITVEEQTYLWLPPWRPDSPPEMDECVHVFQKDPWCWAPLWGEPDLACPRCGEPVDPRRVAADHSIPIQSGAVQS